VEKAKPPADRRALVLADGGGLYLQVSLGAERNIRKSWCFRYERFGRRHEMGLGSAHDVSLAEARDKAAEYRKQLLTDEDPLRVRRAKKQSLKESEAKQRTFKECTEAYLRAHADGWRSRHARQWADSVRQYAFPTLGPMLVQDIETAHVLHCLQAHWQEIPETMSRVRGRIEKILGYAIAAGYRPDPNPARWTSHLATLLPARRTLRPTVHHKALPYDRVGDFLAELRQRDNDAARCLAFQILCAVRPGEAVGAQWAEIDLSKRLWVIPKTRMKGAHEHRVPLPPAAEDILMAMKHREGRIFNTGKTSVRNLAKAAGSTVHGFRSCFTDWAHERTNYPKVVIDMALAHKVADAVEAAYRRGDLFEKRAQLMAAWADFLAKPTIAPAGSIVPLRRVP
jgi:integrase